MCHARRTSRFGHRSGWKCGALERAVRGAAPSRCEAEFLEVGHSVEMNKRSRDHQDVEQLVGVELEMADRETRSMCDGNNKKNKDPLRLTQISHFPGKNRSGMRAAYRQAPVM